MKRTEKHTIRGTMHRHFDLERKITKQAEARLSQSLQRLEAICLYHMKLLTREQRQLQEELQRLQKDLIKKKASSYFASGTQKQPNAFLFSPQGGQKEKASQPKTFRAPATNVPQELYKANSQMPPFHHRGLTDTMRRREQSMSQNYRAAHFTQEMPQGQENNSKSPPKCTDSSKGVSILGQHLSTSALDQDAGSHPNDERTACVDEIRSTDASLQTDKDTGEEIPTSPIGSISAGNIPEETTSSTYLELYAKVKNARYLRHRVPPESERLLSIGEIFGHEKSLLFREGVPT